MVHPAALAISFGVVLGGAIFALFFYNSRNQHNEYRYEERPRRDPLELMRQQFELYVKISINNPKNIDQQQFYFNLHSVSFQGYLLHLSRTL